MLPTNFTKALTAASANAIALSQSVSAAVAQVSLSGAAVVGGVATFPSQRRVIITSSGNETPTTFVINGTNDAGTTISERLQGANVGVAVSALDYKTVTSIGVPGGSVAGFTVGTNTT